MSQGFWKIYKSKVLKSFTAEEEEEIKEQNNDTAMDMTAEEGSSPVSLLAKKVQGASAKGWKCMSSLFNKDDEHKLLQAENTAPVEQQARELRAEIALRCLLIQQDHGSHVPTYPSVLSEPTPKEPEPERKAATGFWDVFATRWNQVSEAKKTPDAGSGEGEATSGTRSEASDTDNSCGSGQYTSLEEEPTDPGFKWNFVTSKLAELKNKSMQKNN